MAGKPLVLAAALLLMGAMPGIAQDASSPLQGGAAEAPAQSQAVPSAADEAPSMAAPANSDTAPATVVPGAEAETSATDDRAAAPAAGASDTGASDTGAADTGVETTPDAAAETAGTGVTDIAPAPVAEPAGMVQGAVDQSIEFLVTGGPSIWAIAALSVITVALILWKIWRLILSGAWSRRTSRRAVEAWEQGDGAQALAIVRNRKGLRSRLVTAALKARLSLDDTAAREETGRIAKRLLASQGSALRALELIATIAPLLGLLGTVMGMISAFQALQEAGSSADPSMLAGGIWEALLTTAAGMAVAIPASAALTWFEAVLENLRTDLEDLAARVFVADLPGESASGMNIAKLAAQ